MPRASSATTAPSGAPGPGADRAGLSPPSVFAGRQTPERAALLAAPVHAPHPSRLAEVLEVSGARAARGAAALGLDAVGDLLEHLPFRHEDRRQAQTITALVPGEEATVVVEVQTIRGRPVRRRGLSIVEATVADPSGEMKAVWFNQPWVPGRLPAGTRVVLHGRLAPRGFQVSEYEAAGGATGAEDLQSTGLVPVYPANADVSSSRLRALAFGLRDRLADVPEPLPARLRRRERLPDRQAALAAVHFPAVPEDEPAGRRRLAFEELLLGQLATLRRRARREEGARARALILGDELIARWRRDVLPFGLTGDQLRACAEVDADLARDRPMQRLLMGEVGSGKTTVALHAMLRAVESGGQATLMAPTEVLAEQHLSTLERLMPHALVPIGLLTGSTPARARAQLLARLASGELALLVGTHALIEQTVVFASLHVAVVDEQHRFGVRQRAALDAKGAPDGGGGHLAPHILHMTATPIPRTLALTRYGDLDVTALRELPRGRRPITTHVAATARERARAYERLREELAAGRQGFVVCPLVEESEALAARAATAERERLAAGELRGFRVELLHGQMPTGDKQRAMAAFASGEADVLVATTVIEVGIDIPNATVMLVEDAERYGISQLHQLRGRIGRGAHPSVCVLFGSADSPRLAALAEHADGFGLAEIDLRLRGEGELIGVRQSGTAEFRVARLPDDAALLERARHHAVELLSADPGLAAPDHVPLADALTAAYGAESLAPIPG